MDKIKLILKPRAGLGNRMRAISSYIHLKNELDARLFVIWEPDKGLNAHYRDLFEPNPHFTLLDSYPKYKFLITRYRLTGRKLFLIGPLVRLYNNFVKKIIKVDYLIFDIDTRKGYDHIKSICKEHKTIFINTGGSITDDSEGLRSFVPTIRIRNIIEEKLKYFNGTMIGMHIRRTDHKRSIENSPRILFEQKIEYYLNKYHNNVYFFLATDDPQIESFLQKKYGKNMVTYSKTFGRDSLEGVRDAVVDLYLLSKTSKIYGSFWSSYSTIAAKISGIELETVQINRSSDGYEDSPKKKKIQINNER